MNMTRRYVHGILDAMTGVFDMLKQTRNAQLTGHEPFLLLAVFCQKHKATVGECTEA
jgi:hypothetical protein